MLEPLVRLLGVGDAQGWHSLPPVEAVLGHYVFEALVVCFKPVVARVEHLIGDFLKLGPLAIDPLVELLAVYGHDVGAELLIILWLNHFETGFLQRLDPRFPLRLERGDDGSEAFDFGELVLVRRAGLSLNRRGGYGALDVRPRRLLSGL